MAGRGAAGCPAARRLGQGERAGAHARLRDEPAGGRQVRDQRRPGRRGHGRGGPAGMDPERIPGCLVQSAPHGRTRRAGRLAAGVGRAGRLGGVRLAGARRGRRRGSSRAGAARPGRTRGTAPPGPGDGPGARRGTFLRRAFAGRQGPAGVLGGRRVADRPVERRPARRGGRRAVRPGRADPGRTGRR